MPAQPFESLLRNLHTTDDVEALLDGIQLFQTQLYKSDKKTIAEKMDETLPAHAAKEIKQEMAYHAIDGKNPEEVKRLLSALKETLSHMKTVSLTLSFDPPQKTIEKVSGSIKQSFGPQAVIEISLRPQILGGAVIVANGRYIDKSLKKKLDILFDVKRTEIQKILTTK